MQGCALKSKKNVGKELLRVLGITLFHTAALSVTSKYDPSPAASLNPTPSSSDHGLHMTPEPAAGVDDLPQP